MLDAMRNVAHDTRMELTNGYNIHGTTRGQEILAHYQELLERVPEDTARRLVEQHCSMQEWSWFRNAESAERARAGRRAANMARKKQAAPGEFNGAEELIQALEAE